MRGIGGDNEGVGDEANVGGIEGCWGKGILGVRGVGDEGIVGDKEGCWGKGGVGDKGCWG